MKWFRLNKKQKDGFLDMLLATLGTRLLGSMLAGKRVIQAGEGVLRAVEGVNRAAMCISMLGQDF